MATDYTDEEIKNFTPEQRRMREARLKQRAANPALEDRAATKTGQKEPKREEKPAPAVKQVHKGVLERTADKLESGRAKYNHQKTQVVRIKNALVPPKQKRSAPAGRAPVYRRAPSRGTRRAARPRYARPRMAPPSRYQQVPAYRDPLNDHILGPPAGSRVDAAAHINNMIGLGTGQKGSGMDFMNTMLGAGSRKSGGREFWRDLMGK